MIPATPHALSLYRLCFAVLVILLSGCREMSQDANDTMAVQENFQQFRTAVVEHDGESASRLVSQTTSDYFETLRGNALHYTPEQVQELALYQQVELLLLRDRITGVELQTLNGRSLLAKYVQEGWINTDLFRSLRVGNVICKGDVAEARIADDDGLLGQRFGFIREAEGWRFDLWVSLSHVDHLYKIGMTNTQSTPGEYLKKLLLQEAKTRPLDSLWEPLIPETTDAGEVAHE